ncbi:MAG TPA: PAS domain S-box protein [Candidatus Udaeobacter sp.]
MAISRAETVDLRRRKTPGKRRARSLKRKAAGKIEARRRRSEEALRQSDVPFRRYFDLGLIGMAITSPTKGIIEVNDELCRILGYERSKLLQKSWPEMTHPEDLAADVAQFKRVLAGEIDGYSLEKRWIRKDGHVIHSIMSAKCKRRANGSVHYFVGLILDITGRKRVEERLREYEKAVEGSEEMICVVDSDYRFRLANRAFLDFRGLKREQVEGHLVSELLTDKRILEIAKRKLTECLQGNVVQYELRHHSPRLGERDLFITYFPIEDRNGVDCVAGVIRDVTERKRAEEEQRKLASLVENSADFIGMASPEGVVFYVNSAGQKLVGLKGSEEARTTRITDYVIEQELPRVEQEILPTVRRNGTWQGEVGFRHFGTGAAIPMLVNSFVIYEQGSERPLALATISRDITKIKRAEEELRRNAAYLAQGQRLSHTGSWALNLATRELFWSEEHFRILGLDPKLGTPPYAVAIKSIHPEDRVSAVEAFERAIREKTEFETQCRIVRPDGTIRIIRSVAQPVFNNTVDLVEYVGAMIDVTDQLRAEEKLRRSEAHLAEAQRIGRVGSWIWNVATGECFWSREHFRIFGLDADTFKPTKKNTQRLIHREDLPFVEATLKKAVREKSEFELEYRIIRPNGSIRYHQSVGRPLERGNRELEFIGMVVDVTERKQAEKALQETQTELAHVSRMTAMGETAASIAHEINQPLGAIVNNGNFSLQLVGKPGVEKKQREALRNIVSDASRASDIISRVRALTTRWGREPSELNVRELIGEVLTLAKHSLDEHRITVKTKLPKDALTVHADRVQLQQVLLNLVVNAIEAMTGVPREKRILAIGAGRDKLDRKPAVLVAITDKGVGFAPKTAARMFDAFYTTKPDGMGMGLRISRSIIQGYGGQLSARRNKSGGATFSFVLPV